MYGYTDCKEIVSNEIAIVSLRPANKLDIQTYWRHNILKDFDKYITVL